MMSGEPPSLDASEAIRQTREWLERAVIGLNLCPFAPMPYRQGRVRFATSRATSPSALLLDLEVELDTLVSSPVSECETSLLIHPWVLNDFIAFNDFLALADDCLDQRGLVGIIQIASFHPQYQFADSAPGDIENCSNRSPFPTLHLLRETSIEQAIAAVEDTDAIYHRNIQTLRALGHSGWDALWQRPEPTDDEDPPEADDGPRRR